MTKFVYIFLWTGICCLLEILLRNFGLFFPCCALFVFYASTAFGVGWGMTAACLGALSLDFTASGASHPWSVLIFSSVVYLSEIWLRKIEADSILINFLPGAVIPVLVWLLSVFFFAQHIPAVLTEQFPILFPAAAAGSVLLPLLIFLLDTLNMKLNLPLFTDAKLKQKLSLQ